MMVAVIGAGDCNSEIYRLAEETGALLGQKGYTTICGGLGGVMEAVCKGAKSSGGKTIGILPGSDPNEANSFVDFPIATGMGIGRNIVIIRSAEAVIAIDGKYGTLSELAFALQLNKPVIGSIVQPVARSLTFQSFVKISRAPMSRGNRMRRPGLPMLTQKVSRLQIWPIHTNVNREQ